MTHFAFALSLAVLAPFWLLLGALLASLRVLLVAPRCLLGLSWPPLDALEALFATDEVLRGVPKRFSNNIRISNVDFSKMLFFSKDSCYF